MVTVITSARTLALTTLAHVKAEIGVSGADYDSFLEARIEDASRAAAEFCERTLVREVVSERYGGGGRPTIVLEQTPVVELRGLSHEDLGTFDVLASGFDRRCRIQNPGAGIVWREESWDDDAPWSVGLSVTRVPMQGPEPWTATYLGGWLTRADDIAASGVALSEEGVLTVPPAGEGLPLLARGDVVRLRGFANGRNNRRFVVLAAEEGESESTITLDLGGRTVTEETAGYGAVVEVRTLPADIERAVVEAVRIWYYRRSAGRDPGVKSEKIGDWQTTYDTGSGAGESMGSYSSLPASAAAMLSSYQRLM